MRASSWFAVLTVSAILAGSALVPASGQDKQEKTDKTEKSDKPKEKDPTERNLDAYRLRVGDVVTISVFNGKKMAPELTVANIAVPGNGDVSFPPIGKIHLLDRTTFDVEATVTQRFLDDGYLQTPVVGCVVTHYEPRVAFLIGAIRGEIELPIHRNMRIIEVLAKAGSLGSIGADFTHVRVRRVGVDGQPFPFDVNVDDILERNDEQQNVVIFENDMIIVPKLESANPQSADWVYVLGKVHAPGRQPMVKGRTPFTLTKLIAMCGDFQEFADRTKVKIIRTTATGREPIPVDFDDIIEGKRPDIELRPDDLVYVPENWI
jgi:polysaccharide export outer membrane protein